MAHRFRIDETRQRWFPDYDTQFLSIYDSEGWSDNTAPVHEHFEDGHRYRCKYTHGDTGTLQTGMVLRVNRMLYR